MELFFSAGPKIYTFNYDNLFERLLYGHLTTYHELSAEEAIEKIEKLNVIHVYGDIGDVEGTVNLSDNGFYQSCQERIKVIGEDRSEEKLATVSKNFDDDCMTLIREVQPIFKYPKPSKPSSGGRPMVKRDYWQS